MSDRDQLVASLNEGKDELLSAVEGMTDREAGTKPKGGGWSALECVEHIATVEILMLRRLKTQATVVQEECSRDREPMLYARIAARHNRVEAPEAVVPKGRHTTLDQAVSAFLDARGQTVRWLEACDSELRRRVVEHPALGPASAHEFILIMAGHVARHARQINENKLATS